MSTGRTVPDADSARGDQVAWGAWETVAATFLFSVPALALLAPQVGGGVRARGSLDAVGWLIIAAGLMGAVVLTLVARGVTAARTLLTMGVSTGLMWFVIGLISPGSRALGAVYRPLVIVTLVAHCNLLPAALFEALGQVQGRLAGLDAPDVPAVHGTRRLIWGVAASAAGLDLTPVVYLMRPGHTRWIIAATWLAVCIVVGGVLTVLATGEIGAYARALEAGEPPARGNE
ncbi:MAG: hypothetical protein ACYSU0_04145 [Planctomycetota bacterium]|jgi:hypothetical protein